MCLIETDIDQITLSVPNIDGMSQWDRVNQIVDELRLKGTLGPFSEESPRNRSYDRAIGWGDTGKNIQIMWRAGELDYDLKQGLLIYFDATGKRLFDLYTNYEELGYRWQELVGKVYDLGGHVTRIDIAIDVYNSDVILSELYQDVKDGKIQVKNQNNQTPTIGEFAKDFETTGITINSRSSDAYGRFYDKRKEQIDKLGPFYERALGFKSWIRLEGEFKHKLARKIGKQISDCDSFNDLNEFLVTQIISRWKLIKNGELLKLWRMLKIKSHDGLLVTLGKDELKSFTRSIRYFLNGGGASLMYKIYRVYGQDGLDYFEELLLDYFDKVNELDGFHPSLNVNTEINKIRQEVLANRWWIDDYWNDATGLIEKEKEVTKPTKVTSDFFKIKNNKNNPLVNRTPRKTEGKD